MSYLYGDSTASTLKANFLEYLRDATDFCVFVLGADARIKEGRARIDVLGQSADTESDRLDRFVMGISRAVENADKGDTESPTAQCAARLGGMIVEAHRTTLDGIRQGLADAIARIEAEEATAREGCVKALGTLLAPHDPPDGTATHRFVMGTDGTYHAALAGTCPPELAWTLELEIPDGHAWASPMRVERLAPHLEIKAPQLAGWITKEVRTKPQRLERHVVSEIVDDGTVVRVELRTEANHDVGFDFEIDPAAGKVVKAARIGGGDDPAVGAFEVQADDQPALVDLAAKLRESMQGSVRKPQLTATVAGEDFRTLTSYVDFVTSLVAVLEPIVTEIAQRSLTPTELVLRRALGNGRREEIFVAKSTLREKLSVLTPEQRALFAPLGLDDGRPAARASRAPDETPPMRSELPPSVPPPPMLQSTPPIPKPPAPPSMKPAGSIPPLPVSTFAPVGPTGRTIQPPQGAPPPPPPSTPIGTLEVDDLDDEA